MTEPEVDESTTWESVLRRMLPAGAPLPDEDHLDYSIAVEYDGPPVPYAVPEIDPVDVDSISVKMPSIISDSTSTSTPIIPVISSVIPKFSGRRNVNLKSSNGRRSSSSVFKTRSEESDSGHLVRRAGVETRRLNTVLFETESESPWPNHTPSSSPVMGPTRSEGESRRRRGVCSRCGRGNRMKQREPCIVCVASYCSNCVVKAMGSMPEGRKCVNCIGQPIDEAKRLSLGKNSRILERVCSPLEVKQILKAERECWANQLRPEQLVVNGRLLREEELAVVLGCSVPPQKLKPGSYWYDKDSGLWGKVKN
ncbi:unnamed protein product [Ilex paraguariensis]|uniref:Extra-large guanine nucleotide-binding protein 3 n=1 Tax=Ilex paraguariensis TaxID=185542 RepID=A0ABC8V5L5_9AQUA